MDAFLWWSGVCFWAILAGVGALKAIDMAVEWVIDTYGLYGDIAQFIVDRARKRRAAL